MDIVTYVLAVLWFILGIQSQFYVAGVFLDFQAIPEAIGLL
jgi:hypothetical protein